MITPEEARAELARRGIPLQGKPQGMPRSKITPEEARAELARRGIPVAAPQSKFQTGMDLTMGAFNALPDSPATRIQKGLRTLGGNIAEKGGQMGYPKMGVALGAPVALAPDLLAAGTGLEGVFKSEAPFIQAIRKTPRMVGSEMDVGERAAGISPQIPERSGRFPRFEPPEYRGFGAKQPKPIIPAEPLPSAKPVSYPAKPPEFVNWAKKRIGQFGDRLSKQELADMKNTIRTMFQNEEINPGTLEYKEATTLNQDVNRLYNKAIPGRAELNKVYSLSTKMRPLTNPRFWRTAGPMIGYGSLGAVATELIKKLLFSGQ